jgi:Cupin domain
LPARKCPYHGALWSLGPKPILPAHRRGQIGREVADKCRQRKLRRHMVEEEHALILEGQVTLLLGDERYEMKAGDYVWFPAGQKVGHEQRHGPLQLSDDRRAQPE